MARGRPRSTARRPRRRDSQRRRRAARGRTRSLETATRVARRTAGSRRWALDRGCCWRADPAPCSRSHGARGLRLPRHRRLLAELPANRPHVLHLHNLHGGYFDIRALPATRRARSPRFSRCTTCGRSPATARIRSTASTGGPAAATAPTWSSTSPSAETPAPRTADQARTARAASAPAFATPSQWLMRMVGRAACSAEAAEARVIPNGVDTDVFRPGDRERRERQLGLPLDATILLFAGTRLRSNPVQGLRDAVERSADAVGHAEAIGSCSSALGDESAASRHRGRRGPTVSRSSTTRDASQRTTRPRTCTCTRRLPRTSLSRSSRRWRADARGRERALAASRRSSWTARVGCWWRRATRPSLADAVGTLLDDMDRRRSFAQPERGASPERFTAERRQTPISSGTELLAEAESGSSSLGRLGPLLDCRERPAPRVELASNPCRSARTTDRVPQELHDRLGICDRRESRSSPPALPRGLRGRSARRTHPRTPRRRRGRGARRERSGSC